MSWLSAVTGKAEDFLNKLDKSAADVLTHEEGEGGEAGVAVSGKANNVYDPSYPKRLTPSKTAPSQLHNLNEVDKSSSYVSGPIKSNPKTTHSSTKTSTLSPLSTNSSSSSSSQGAVKSPTAKKTDDALFDFLNSTEENEKSKKRRTPVSSRHHSRQSSSSSVKSSKGAKPSAPNVAAKTETSGDQLDNSRSSPVEDSSTQRASPTNSNVSADVDIIADAMKESPAASDQSNPGSDHLEASAEEIDRQLSSYELENRLLRNEVASLNDEMATVIQRAKGAESELIRSKNALRSQSSSAALHDQLVRELQAREADLTEALTAKDSQLAVLRVRLEEADRQLNAQDRSLDEIRQERERILRDHSDSSGIHSQALDSLKEKLEEVQTALKREQLAYTQAQQEASERQSRHEQEQMSMAESLKSSEKKLSEEKAKISEMSSNLKAAKTSADSAKRELTDYKEKAARILQSKEKLISSLREGGSGSLSDGSGVSSLEHDAMRQERDMLVEELQQTKLTVENLRVELQDVETQLQQESDTSQETIMSLEDSVKEEKRRREDAEAELLSQKQELQYMTEELRKQKTSFQSRLTDRENEIDRLRNQLMTKSMSSSTEGELENRVRSLTESLIQKQTVLEALSTEKNSLVLQLERTEQQVRDIESAMPRQSPGHQMVAVHDHDDDVRQRLPMFMKEVPSDHEIARRMKRAANSIDVLSIRLGVFLRRYPIARVFVIVYMAMLHFWVLLVMMTYQPEIHGHDFMPHAPDHPPETLPDASE